MPAKATILILYSELAEYTVACLHELLKKNVAVHVVRWPVNKEAPFQFEIDPEINLYEREKFNASELIKLAKKIKPSAIVSSGWMDKDYTQTCRYYFRKIPTVLTLDNHWTGSLKQHIATLISPFTLLKTFSHVWVPGNTQKKYALKLGFPEENIRTGFYSANTNLYHQFYVASFSKKEENYPKVLLYVGRYVKHKGIYEMWDAFISLQNEISPDWELWCVGTGDEYPNRVNHPKIRHFGFVQPKDMQKIITQSGAYILPSKFEPWGVSVHEFATAGLPLLLSEKVGAAEKFLIPGVNGFQFKTGTPSSIKEAMKKLFQLSTEELIQMGKQSHKIGRTLTPDMWADTLLSFLN